MSLTSANMERRLERQVNDLIGTIHVLETTLSIMLRNLLEGQRDGVVLLRAIKTEVVATIQGTSAISGDPADSLRIQGTHSMIAEAFFARIEEALPKGSVS